MSLRHKRYVVFIAVAGLMASVSGASAQLTVFDPLNYEQNLLQAVRSLDAVRTQIQQLQTQALALARMDQNLLPQAGSISPQLQSSLTSLRTQVSQGDAIALSVRDTDANYLRLYPAAFPDALNGNGSIGVTDVAPLLDEHQLAALEPDEARRAWPQRDDPADFTIQPMLAANQLCARRQSAGPDVVDCRGHGAGGCLAVGDRPG